eukprot:Plantae.Rhodophyta-Purpureofilum_apyrenoidigerum.ctg2317.p1 GENE.Plantae.Rhodophyta-Purpureofilum_apyrenoidigerum.ctg2317~~Plantae.Rhodophyta-Purpureofilum_apyrenoidigerum.ctg2317.p1  ORF type:complete len:427 (-),score=28.31 Plantae.Rhodophyta-Purpureofilum_apyrenoidigerum.ctg2317:680-1960(-)
MVSFERFADGNTVPEASTDRNSVRDGGGEEGECDTVGSLNNDYEEPASPVNLTPLRGVWSGCYEKACINGAFETPTRNQICSWSSPLGSEINFLSGFSPGFPASINTEGTEADNCDLLLSPTAFQFLSPSRGDGFLVSTPVRVSELLSSPTLDSSLSFNDVSLIMTSPLQQKPKIKDEVNLNTADMTEQSPSKTEPESDTAAKKSPQATQGDLENTPQNAFTKKCRCKKTKCLKLYCDCFAVKQRCGPECGCIGCENTPENSDRVEEAVKTTLERNPKAFNPKIMPCSGGPGMANGSVLAFEHHNRGCNCKKSGCSKKYCECFYAGVPCGAKCKCMGCRNCYSQIGGRPRWPTSTRNSKPGERLSTGRLLPMFPRDSMPVPSGVNLPQKLQANNIKRKLEMIKSSNSKSGRLDSSASSVQSCADHA